jgi:hypothetical protein
MPSAPRQFFIPALALCHPHPKGLPQLDLYPTIPLLSLSPNPPHHESIWVAQTPELAVLSPSGTLIVPLLCQWLQGLGNLVCLCQAPQGPSHLLHCCPAEAGTGQQGAFSFAKSQPVLRTAPSLSLAIWKGLLVSREGRETPGYCE